MKQKQVYTQATTKAKVQAKNLGFNMKSVTLGKSLRGQEIPEKKTIRFRAQIMWSF